MASDIFAKLGDIKGESLDAKHKDEIEVLSYSWGVTNAGSMGHGSGGGEGKATFHDLSFVHAIDKASPVLMQACATGVHIKEGTITAPQGRQGTAGVPDLKMNDIIVTGVQHGGSGDGHSENVSLAFAKVSLEYKPQKPDGSLDAGRLLQVRHQGAEGRIGGGTGDGAPARSRRPRRRRGHVPGGQRRQGRPDQRRVAGQQAQERNRGARLVLGHAGQAVAGRRRRVRQGDDSRAPHHKRVDKASTALMSALRTNEPIKLATLTIRKVGKTPLEYLRSRSRTAASCRSTSRPVTRRTLRRSSSGVSLFVQQDHRRVHAQGPDGNALGATSFTDEWTAG